MRRARPPYTLRTLSVRAVLCTLALLLVSVLPPAPLPPAHAATGQVSVRTVCTAQTPTANATRFRGWTNGVAAWDATEDDAQALAGGTGAWTISNWSITLNTAPGGSEQYAFTLRKNTGSGAVDAGPAITIAAGATTGVDNVNTGSFSPGDRICVKCVASTAPAAPGLITFAYKVTAAASNQTWWTFSSSNSHTETGTNTYFTHSDGALIGTPETGLSTFADPVASGGTISALYAQCESDPTSGSITVTCRTATAGGAASMASTTLTCTISAGGKTANDTTHSVVISAGALVDWTVTTSGMGANATRIRFGALFAPTVNGDMVINHNSVVTQNSTQFEGWYKGFSTTEATDLDQALLAGTAKNLYLDTSGNSASAPVSGQTITITFQSGNSSPLTASTLTCAVTGDGGTTKTANDLTHTVSVATTFMDLKAVTTATTGNVACGFSFVYSIAQPSSGDPSALLLRGVGSRPIPLFASGRAN